jgi:hypothetical protein
MPSIKTRFSGLWPEVKSSTKTVLVRSDPLPGRHTILANRLNHGEYTLDDFSTNSVGYHRELLSHM